MTEVIHGLFIHSSDKCYQEFIMLERFTSWLSILKGAWEEMWLWAEDSVKWRWETPGFRASAAFCRAINRLSPTLQVRMCLTGDLGAELSLRGRTWWSRGAPTAWSRENPFSYGCNRHNQDIRYLHHSPNSSVLLLYNQGQHHNFQGPLQNAWKKGQ